MANKFTISTVFAAVNNMTNPINSMTKSVDNLGDKVDKTKSKMSSFGSVMKGIGGGVLAIGGAMAGAALGVYKLAEGVSTLGDNVAKTARSMGMTTDALQEFRYIGERSGVTVDEMDVALKKLTINLGKEADSTVTSLAMLGLSVDQMKAAGPDEALNMIAEGMKNISDPAARAAVAVELFGKGGVKMVNVMAEGKDGMAKLADEAHRVGYVLGQDTLDASEKLNDSILNMQTSFKAMGNQLAAKFMPLINDAVDGLTNFMVENRAVFDDVASGLVAVFQNIGPIVKRMLPLMARVIKTVGDTLNKVFKIASPTIEKLTGAFEKMLPSVIAIVEAVAELLAPAFEVLEPILDILLPILGAMIQGIALLAKIIVATLKPVLEWMKNAFTVLRDVLGAVWSGITAGASAVWAGLTAGFSAVANGVVAAWDGVVQFFTVTVPGAIQAGFQAAVDFVMNLIQPLLDVIANIQNGLASIGIGSPTQTPVTATASGPSVPMSPLTSTINRNTNSTVDFNFNNPPAGSSVSQKGTAPGINLNMGRIAPQ